MNNDSSSINTPEQTWPNKVFFKIAVVTIVAAALLVVLGLVSYIQDSEQKELLSDQSKKTNQLIEQNNKLVQQNKELSQQTKDLSQRAVNYAYCNSIILAKYTQTLSPIEVQDLNKCILNSFPGGFGAPQSNASSGVGESVSQTQQPHSDSNTSSGNTQTPTPNNPQNPPANNGGDNEIAQNSVVDVKLPDLNQVSPLIPSNAICVSIPFLLKIC